MDRTHPRDYPLGWHVRRAVLEAADAAFQRTGKQPAQVVVPHPYWAVAKEITSRYSRDGYNPVLYGLELLDARHVAHVEAPSSVKQEIARQIKVAANADEDVDYFQEKADARRKHGEKARREADALKRAWGIA